ncbi:transglycosylase family protein [Nocardia sp. NPDC050710]|uniref:transglycosylase family protein n=1 Tax=Nocardia sp. NPDC050710 TaxID=3157220 RepID=UPI0033D30E66
MSHIRKISTRTIGLVSIVGALVAVPLGISAATASASGHNWDAVAQCESGGNWGIDTGNGFSGGLQFTDSTWAANGGSGSASNASKDEQIRVAENVLATQGAGAWPVCGAYL